MEQKYYKTKDGYVSSNTELDNDIATEITKEQFLEGIKELESQTNEKIREEINKHIAARDEKKQKLQDSLTIEIGKKAADLIIELLNL